MMKRCRNRLTAAQQVVLALLSGRRPHSPKPNWPEILRIAGENRVKPLIYDSVRALRLDVPEEFLLPLERSYAATFANNCEILSALDEMGRILSQHGIDVVPIKGASLIQRVYKDPGLRPLLDLDVWIDGENARSAKRILLDAGFAKKMEKTDNVQLRKVMFAPTPYCKRLNAEIDPLIGHRFFRKRETCSTRKHLSPLMLPRGGGIMLEIHHRLAWDLSILSLQLARDIWNRRKPLAGKKGLALVSEEDELIILAAHLLGHRKRDRHNLLQHVDIALAWQKKAWRFGIEITDNQEVKELVDLSVAALIFPDHASASASCSGSFQNMFSRGIRQVVFEKNEKSLRRLVKIWKVYGFFKFVRYIVEWVFPYPAEVRIVNGNQKANVFRSCFHHLVARIRRLQ